MEDKINCKPAPQITLIIDNSSPLACGITDASNMLKIQEIIITKNASPKNSAKGSGSLLPRRSTTSRNFWNNPFFSFIENPPIFCEINTAEDEAFKQLL